MQPNTSQQHNMSNTVIHVCERGPTLETLSRQASHLVASEFNEGSGFDLSRGSVQRLKLPIRSLTPARNPDTTLDYNGGGPSYRANARGTEKMVTGGRRDWKRGRDMYRFEGSFQDKENDSGADREKDWERDLGQDQKNYKNKRGSKMQTWHRDNKYKHSDGRARDGGKDSSHARSRSPTKSNSRSRSSRRRSRSSSGSPGRRASVSNDTKRQSVSHSLFSDSYHIGSHPRTWRRVFPGRMDIREYSNEGNSGVKRLTPRVDVCNRDGNVTHVGGDKNSTRSSGIRQMVEVQAKHMCALSTEEWHNAPVPVWRMNGPDMEMELLTKVETPAAAEKVPQYDILLPADSMPEKLREDDATEDAADRRLLPVGTSSRYACSDSFERQSTQTAAENLPGPYPSAQEIDMNPRTYQSFPVEVEVDAPPGFGLNPSLDFGLKGKKRMSSPCAVEWLPWFTQLDSTHRSPDINPCNYVETPGVSSISVGKEESQDLDASSSLDLSLILGVPKYIPVSPYEKMGNSWVKLDDKRAAICEEDVEFALRL
ncbi:hypothetical protein R1flu_015049 [Riccia fluitans]|uniref:Btz domain-containing protein n=1 Tax=Riccia fluitans TaxID=41844 RepID=A0ABD1YHU1_9MARC